MSARPCAPKSKAWLLATLTTSKPAASRCATYEGGVRKAKQEVESAPHFDPPEASVSGPSRLPKTMSPRSSPPTEAKEPAPPSGGSPWSLLPIMMSPTAAMLTGSVAVLLRGSGAAGDRPTVTVDVAAAIRRDPSPPPPESAVAAIVTATITRTRIASARRRRQRAFLYRRGGGRRRCPVRSMRASLGVRPDGWVVETARSAADEGGGGVHRINAIPRASTWRGAQ